MSSGLLRICVDLPDPRRHQGKMHPLPAIQLFTVLAMLPGARSYGEVQCFIETHPDRLNQAFGLSFKRASACSSVRFLLRGLDVKAVEQVFRRNAPGLACAPVTGEAATRLAVPIQNRALRGSFEAFHDLGATHLLGAFTGDGNIILRHLAVAVKCNETPAAQATIAELGRVGHLFTTDAMHSEKTLDSAIQSGNHRHVQLKSTQLTLLQAVTAATDHVEKTAWLRCPRRATLWPGTNGKAVSRPSSA